MGGNFFAYCLVFFLSGCSCMRMFPGSDHGGKTVAGNTSTVIQLRMPGVTPSKDDDYICMAQKVDQNEMYITEFRVEGTAEKAHHLILYGCDIAEQDKIPWDCGHHGVCKGQTSILFAWAKNAPKTSLPPSVGFRVGGRSNVKYYILQIHYAHPLPAGEKDHSGIDISITSQEQQYLAGIFLLLANQVVIPPFQPKVHGDVSCVLDAPAKLHLFAFRTHAHALGRVITGYKFNKQSGKMEEIARGNPQWPQAFYPMKQLFEVDRGDILFARCTFNSTTKNTTTNIGMNSGDEMCNLYIMYYTDPSKGSAYDICVDEQMPGLAQNMLPADSDEQLPPNPLLEHHAVHGGHVEQNAVVAASNSSLNMEHIDYKHIFANVAEDPMTVPTKKGGAHVMKKPLPEPGEDVYDVQSDVGHVQPVDSDDRPRELKDTYTADSKWPASLPSQPSAVGIDSKGNVIIFHRGNRAWGQHTFGPDNRLSDTKQGPIQQPVIISVDPSDGRVISQAGGNTFYLPHGLTVDHDDNLWLTDVGAHQVFKMSPLTDNTTSLKTLIELGKRLEPGSDDSHFCKPTSVAVLPSGEFFVADGYCNSRIIKFNNMGRRIAEWGEKPASGFFGRKPSLTELNLPHSITLVPDKDMVCVADRENGRIMCFSTTDGQFRTELKFPEFGSSVYAVAYSAGFMYAVNGPSFKRSRAVPAQGFIIDMNGTGEIVSAFATSGLLGQPHWLALGSNGSTIFVADINPYRIVKLVNASVPSVAKQQQESNPVAIAKDKPSASISSIVDLAPVTGSMIVLCVVTVIVLCIILIVVIVKLSKKGFCCGKSENTSKLDLGNLLQRDPIRGGFEKLAMDDSDVDEETVSDSEAEVVEFTQANRNDPLKA